MEVRYGHSIAETQDWLYVIASHLHSQIKEANFHDTPDFTFDFLLLFLGYVELFT